MTRLLLFTLSIIVCSSAFVQAGRPLRVVSWNVENLFDTLDDAGFRDEEFLPQGERRWTGGRYWRKLNDVARTVAAIADMPQGREEYGSVPDLIGLCEVENDSVMEHLVHRSLLRSLGYEYIVTHSQDARGIDVALLYQPVHFRLLEHRSFDVHLRKGEVYKKGKKQRPTRDILYAKGLVLAGTGVDTLHVLVVHLPSKAGGRAGDKLRLTAASTLWAVVDSLLAMPGDVVASASQPRVVVMGDFNAGGRDRIFRHSPLRLTDDASASGTYCYRGYWQWLDHILVSSSVDIPRAACPLRLPWLLEPNKTYGGDMPFRTYRGPVYHGGISDHLPVVADVEL